MFFLLVPQLDIFSWFPICFVPLGFPNMFPSCFPNHVVPDGFFVTASSPSCEVQGMENEAGDRFGLQFHPEVNDSEFGKEMFENFV